MIQTPDEIACARFFAEIHRVKTQLERFTTGSMRLFENVAGVPGMTDKTATHIEELTAHIAELERFLNLVKAR